MVKNRSIPLCIVLSIITCGIYEIFWFISLTDEVNSVSGEQGTSGMMAFVYGLLTCGIYMLFWYYKMGEKLDRMANDGKNRSMLYLILGFLGLGIVSIAMIQDQLNQYAS